jgi:predicted deacylase
MQVDVLGSGKPDRPPKYAIVACVHGDETCGWHAMNRLRASDVEVREPVKLVLANEQAFRLGKRYCEADLNRVMPGDPNDERHEVRLAARLARELEGARVLDIHATEARTAPLALVVGRDDERMRLARSTGIGRIVDMGHLDGGVTQHVPGVAVECGYHDDASAATMAHRIILNFLAAEGVIDPSWRVDAPSTVDVFEVFDVAGGAGFEFVGENLRRVRRGEVYARRNGDERRAADDFYPVLMSTHGYDEIIGFKARRVAAGRPAPRSGAGPATASV